jgi:hypothetical protein
MLTQKDKEFIYDKSIKNHPGYILDDWFKNNISIDDIENFIKENKDPHYRIIYNLNNLNISNNIINEFKFNINNNTAYIKIPTFRIIPPKNLLNFCNRLKSNNQITNIILDLRNNGGGNSLYVDTFFKKLYGINMFNYIKYKWNKNIKKLWRNSEDIIDKLISYNTLYHNKLVKNMKKTNEDIYTEIETWKKINKPTNLLNKKKIYILINENCFSSCLICIDYFKLINKNILLVGENPTGYDTDYTEIIDFVLPSQVGRIVIPSKKIIGKIRKSFEKYHPDIKNIPKNILH